MKNILLVEDETQVVSFVKKGLTEEGYSITVALDGKSGYQLAKDNNFDLILLDIMLPEMNGLEVCKAIRREDTIVPILFLTALGTPENIVLGLDSGGDDYLVKPFKFIELLARVKSLLRRSDLNNGVDSLEPNANIFRFSDIELNDDSKIVKRNGLEVGLTTTEYRLLLYFLKNKRRVLSRMDMLEEVWGVNFDLGSNVVDVYVNYLRKKIDTNPEKKLIHTVIGMGYVLKD